MLAIDGVPVDHRVRSAYARGRIGEALHEVVLDALGPSHPDLTASGDDAWLRGAIERPIHIATEAALGTLATELCATLEDAPARLRERFEAAPAPVGRRR